MKTKRVLCPERLRHVPHRFSWIDQRLVRDGHIVRCGPQALALYLLLVTVADAQGLTRILHTPRRTADVVVSNSLVESDFRQFHGDDVL